MGVQPHFGKMNSGKTKKTCQVCCDRQKGYDSKRKDKKAKQNAKNNPKNNPKNNAKTSAKLAATKKRLELPVLGLTSEQYDSGIATRIQTSITRVNKILGPGVYIYIGAGRSDLQHPVNDEMEPCPRQSETLKFATKRGKGTPSILAPGGSIVKNTKFSDPVDICDTVLSVGQCDAVEKAVQLHFNDYKLKLWKVPGAGSVGSRAGYGPPKGKTYQYDLCITTAKK
jgi:hypothetical protein